MKAILLKTGIDAILEVRKRSDIWREVNQQISQNIVDIPPAGESEFLAFSQLAGGRSNLNPNRSASSPQGCHKVCGILGILESVRTWSGATLNSSREKYSYWKTQRSNETSANNFSDYMRGVTPYKSTDGHVMKLPSGYTNAWENANGEVILTNTNGYDPNRELNGNWREINKVR